MRRFILLDEIIWKKKCDTFCPYICDFCKRIYQNLRRAVRPDTRRSYKKNRVDFSNKLTRTIIDFSIVSARSPLYYNSSFRTNVCPKYHRALYYLYIKKKPSLGKNRVIKILID